MQGTHQTTGDRLCLAAFLALLVLQCSLFWSFQYFPSQDGPSHLHNASVMADYGKEPVYREYYRLHPFRIAGNSLGQFILVACLKLAAPATAEKLLLTIYVVLLPLSLLYLLRAVTPSANAFSLFAFIFLPNFFLHMGFWNFCFSIPLVLLGLGYYLRHRQRWTVRSMTVLTLMGFAVYVAHSISWVILVVAIAALGLPDLTPLVVSRGRRGVNPGVRREVLRYALPLCTALPPAVLALAYVLRLDGRSAQYPVASFRSALWGLYSLSFLHIQNDPDLMLSKAVVLLIGVLCASAIGAALWRQQYKWSSTPLLLLSLTWAAAVLVLPDRVGDLSYIKTRLALYAWLFLIVWLAVQHWPRFTREAVCVLVCAIAAASLLVRYSVYARWDGRLAEFAAIGTRIPSGSTVLHLILEKKADPYVPRPYLHAVGLFSGKGIVDLRNYEAASDHFPTSFRPDKSPFPALGTVDELESEPPVFDAVRYETRTHGRVDYLLFQGGAGSDRQWPERTLYAKQIAAYQLVYVSPPPGGRFRLYQRSDSESRR